MSETLTIDPASFPDAGWSTVRAFLEEARKAGAVVELAQRPDSMSPAEFARRLSMSRTTVLRRIADGSITATKVGTHHRISRLEYERFRDWQLEQMMEAIGPDVDAELFGE